MQSLLYRLSESHLFWMEAAEASQEANSDSDSRSASCQLEVSVPTASEQRPPGVSRYLAQLLWSHRFDIMGYSVLTEIRPSPTSDSSCLASSLAIA